MMPIEFRETHSHSSKARAKLARMVRDNWYNYTFCKCRFFLARWTQEHFKTSIGSLIHNTQHEYIMLNICVPAPMNDCQISGDRLHNGLAERITNPSPSRRRDAARHDGALSLIH